MKVSKLTGADLDYWVEIADDKWPSVIEDTGGPLPYSTDWSHGGPLVEREYIVFTIPFSGKGDKAWMATKDGSQKPSGFGNLWMYGPTPLVAAMRAFVASKFGEEVSI